MDPSKNTTALLIGTGEFSFSEGATSAANAIALGFIDFGNILAFTPNITAESQEHVGSYRGVRRTDKTVVTKSGIDYALKCDEWSPEILKFLFGGTIGTGLARTALVSQAADSITVVAPTDGQREIWYDICVSGTRQGNLTSVAVATLTENTDFWVDLTLGRIRFKSTVTGAQSLTIDGPAIAATDDEYQIPITPMASPVKRGFGRLVVYDQDSNNKVVLDHRDFSCEVTAESSGEIGANFAEVTIKVKVTETVGSINVRLGNL